MTFTKTQSDMLARIIAALNNMGCNYVIDAPDGSVHKNVKSVSKKRGSVFPVGEIRDYYRPFLEPVDIGMTTEVPFDKFPPNTLQSGIASWCAHTWGPGTFATTINRSKNVVEVIRTGGI